MTKSIVVPVDTSAVSERAVRVAASLGAAGNLPVELLTIAPRGAAVEPIRADLERLAQAVGRCESTIVFDNDVVGALVAELARRPEELIVLGTHARSAFGELLLGSISEDILARSDYPVLLVGPHVGDADDVGSALVAAVANDTLGGLLVPPVARWARLFGTQPWFVQVAPPDGADSPPRPAGSGAVHRAASLLRERGIDAQWDVLHGNDVADELIRFTKTMGGGVVAVASERWADSHRIHWTSTARVLVHRSPFPVLLLPVHDVLAASAR